MGQERRGREGGRRRGRRGEGERERGREGEREADLAIVTPAEHILAGGQMGRHFDDIHDSNDLCESPPNKPGYQVAAR